MDSSNSPAPSLSACCTSRAETVDSTMRATSCTAAGITPTRLGRTSTDAGNAPRLIANALERAGKLY